MAATNGLAMLQPAMTSHLLPVIYAQTAKQTSKSNKTKKSFITQLTSVSKRKEKLLQQADSFQVHCSRFYTRLYTKKINSNLQTLSYFTSIKLFELNIHKKKNQNQACKNGEQAFCNCIIIVRRSIHTPDFVSNFRFRHIRLCSLQTRLPKRHALISSKQNYSKSTFTCTQNLLQPFHSAQVYT